MTKVKRNLNIDFSKYFNVETGESLASEMASNEKGFMISVKENTELVMLEKSENFGFINFDTLFKLNELLSPSDRGYMLQMFELTKTEWNILYNHSVPHTNNTLQKYLGFKSRSKFSELIKRLIKVGVLYQIKGNINGAVRVVYILNPKVANRRKTFNRELLDIFKEF